MRIVLSSCEHLMEQSSTIMNWHKLRKTFLDKLGKKPDINAFLFMIGIEQCGFIKDAYTKEEKQDLVHVAVSEFLCKDGHSSYEGRDESGWPHYKAMSNPPELSIKEQEHWLKTHIVRYFEDCS